MRSRWQFVALASMEATTQKHHVESTTTSQTTNLRQIRVTPHHHVECTIMLADHISDLTEYHTDPDLTPYPDRVHATPTATPEARHVLVSSHCPRAR